MDTKIEHIDGKTKISVSGTINGERIRKTKIVPLALSDEDAQRYAMSMVDADFNAKESIRKVIEGCQQDNGHVYAIKNEYLPGLVKIGMSRNTVHERVRNLNTAYPVDWEIVACESVQHVAAIERFLHAHFSEVRVNRNREFFRISEDDAAKAIRLCHEIDGVDMMAAIMKIGTR